VSSDRILLFCINSPHTYSPVFFLGTVLRRNEQDGVGLEDIDALQLELEALLSATVVRKMTLKEEVKILNNIEKYKGQGKSYKRVRLLLLSSKNGGSTTANESMIFAALKWQ
jgi:hypothetical protein